MLNLLVLFLQPNQQEYFTQLWLEDRVEIYDDMLETLAQNLSHPLARILAFENSTQLATGGAGCKSNTASAGKMFYDFLGNVYMLRLCGRNSRVQFF